MEAMERSRSRGYSMKMLFTNDDTGFYCQEIFVDAEAADDEVDI